MLTVVYACTILTALCTLIGGGVRYTIKAIVAISRWLAIGEVVAQQFRPNHGSSIVDRVANVEAAILEIRQVLAGDELARRREPGA